MYPFIVKPFVINAHSLQNSGTLILAQRTVPAYSEKFRLKAPFPQIQAEGITISLLLILY